MTDHDPLPPANPEPLCAYCGREAAALAAIIYHGVVYHPECVAPTLRRTAPPGKPPPDGVDGAAEPPAG